MVYFKDPCKMDSIIYHAKYVNRPGSVDLGIKSLSGSREANSLILDSALKIMGSRGYALLIEHGIETAKSFAEEINNRSDFELVTPPELNILTYRICPAAIKTEMEKCSEERKHSLNEKLNEINMTVQRLQREAGKSFVSRTTLKTYKGRCESIVVLRCVIMNPLTDINILRDILDEQEEIYRQNF
jgi:glutamate decarboxylase